LEKHYAKKGNIALGEMRDLVPEVEKIYLHKYSLFIIMDVDKRIFNIAIASEHKVT
jgi:hypothetical protein